LNKNDLIYAIRLHENARRFIESAVELASKEWSPELTFAAIHLASGLEILLKTRLAVEDHEQLARKGQTVTRQQFENGDFKSITVDECLSRLENLGVFQLTPRQDVVLRAVQRLRNRAIHYIAPTENEIKSALGAGLNLFIEIDRSEFSHWDPPYQAKPIAQLLTDLSDFDAFVQARLSAITDQLNRARRPRTHYFDECPHCSQDAVIINDGFFECLFCDYENEITCEVEHRSLDGVVDLCPECGTRSFAKHRWYEVGLTKECFCCGYCEGREPRWLDWKTQTEIPRLHPERASSPRVSASISPESVGRTI